MRPPNRTDAKFPPLPPGAVPPPTTRHHYGIPEWLGFGWTGLCVLLAINLPVGLVFLFWAGPAFCLLIVYLIARAGRRLCPVCGNHVRPGLTACGSCGHDYAAAAGAEVS